MTMKALILFSIVKNICYIAAYMKTKIVGEGREPCIQNAVYVFP